MGTHVYVDNVYGHLCIFTGIWNISTVKAYLLNGINDIKYGINGVYLNGNKIDYPIEKYDIPSAFIFKNGGNPSFGKGRIYYISHSDFWKLIPCYRKIDNVAGMYDIINNVFYTNAGTGEFIIGPDVN